MNRLAQCLETLSGDPLDAAGKARVVDRLIELVKTRCGEDLTLEAAAKSVYLTPSYVSYLFKHHTGQTFIRYLTPCRMERAAHLLRSSDNRLPGLWPRWDTTILLILVRYFARNMGKRLRNTAGATEGIRDDWARAKELEVAFCGYEPEV